jgi:hypothetical protein
MDRTCLEHYYTILNEHNGTYKLKELLRSNVHSYNEKIYEAILKLLIEKNDILMQRKMHANFRNKISNLYEKIVCWNLDAGHHYTTVYSFEVLSYGLKWSKLKTIEQKNILYNRVVLSLSNLYQDRKIKFDNNDHRFNCIYPPTFLNAIIDGYPPAVYNECFTMIYSADQEYQNAVNVLRKKLLSKIYSNVKIPLDLINIIISYVR